MGGENSQIPQQAIKYSRISFRNKTIVVKTPHKGLKGRNRHLDRIGKPGKWNLEASLRNLVGRQNKLGFPGPLNGQRLAYSSHRTEVSLKTGPGTRGVKEATHVLRRNLPIGSIRWGRRIESQAAAKISVSSPGYPSLHLREDGKRGRPNILVPGPGIGEATWGKVPKRAPCFSPLDFARVKVGASNPFGCKGPPRLKQLMFQRQISTRARNFRIHIE